MAENYQPVLHSSSADRHEHLRQAASNTALLAHNNGGRPAIAATPRPSAFNTPGAVGAHGAAPVPPHAIAAAYPNRYGNGNGAAHGAAAAHPGGSVANGKPPAPKTNSRQHPKVPPANGKNEEKTVQR